MHVLCLQGFVTGSRQEGPTQLDLNGHTAVGFYGWEGRNRCKNESPDFPGSHLIDAHA